MNFTACKCKYRTQCDITWRSNDCNDVNNALTQDEVIPEMSKDSNTGQDQEPYWAPTLKVGIIVPNDHHPRGSVLTVCSRRIRTRVLLLNY